MTNRYQLLDFRLFKGPDLTDKKTNKVCCK